jgi:hypothetical protein
VRKHKNARLIIALWLPIGLGICCTYPILKKILWHQEENSRDTAPMGAKVSEIAPPGFDQKEWDQELKHCKKVGSEIAWLRSLPPDDLARQTNPYRDADIKTCIGMVAPVENQYQPIRPIYVDPIPPVPVASPTPPSNTLNDASTAPTATSSLPIKGDPVPLGLVHLR